MNVDPYDGALCYPNSPLKRGSPEVCGDAEMPRFKLRIDGIPRSLGDVEGTDQCAVRAQLENSDTYAQQSCKNRATLCSLPSCLSV